MSVGLITTPDFAVVRFIGGVDVAVFLAIT